MDRPKVFTLHYNLKNQLGRVVDTSVGGEPLVVLQGTGAIVKGLELALDGRQAGDIIEVTVPPTLAYGEHRPDLIQTVPRELFDGVEDVNIGMTFQTNSGDHAHVVKVTAIRGDQVEVDGNHPLAGITLCFEVELLDVRDATSEEMRTGYPLVHNLSGSDEIHKNSMN